MRHSIDRMNAAELRALRESMGLSVRALAGVLGIVERTAARWESGDGVLSRRNAWKLERLQNHTDAAVEKLISSHRSGEPIVTFERGEFYSEPYPSEWVLSASWHRMVAWRAAQAIPGAVIRYRGHDS